MSAEDSKVQKICNCLSILTSEIKIADPSGANKGACNIKDAFSNELKRNVHATFQKIENHSFIKTFVTEYIQPCFGEKCTTCDYLKFLQLCLVLLRLLKIALSVAAETCPQKNDTPETQTPHSLLSISQKNVLKKCLEFSVALGILPNLLRGIGIPLSKRLKHAILLEHFTSESTLYQKHIQIAVCLDTLIGCLDCEAMQSTILSYHGTDILAALLQLCYAPIKKLDKAETPAADSAKPVLESNPNSEAQIVNMMLAHRKYFAPHLETFIKLICPSLLMWELLLFQGMPVKTEDPDMVIAKAPIWLRKICNQMLTDMILQSHGIAGLVQVVLDKAYDADISSGKVDTVRMEAVARLVAYNPVRHISVPDYIQKLSKQVFQLLHLRGSAMDNLLKYIASCIIVQLCERDIKSAEEHFLVKLLKPLWVCVREPANTQVQIVVKEAELTRCIEDLYQIFITSHTPLCRKYMMLLFPFSHCLFTMFFSLLKGQCYARPKVKSLIRALMQNCTEEDALRMLHAVSFTNNINCGVYITTVSFAIGEGGGAIAIQKKEEEFPDEIIRYHTILDLLNEYQNKDLNRSYILLVLKEFCNFHMESKDNVMDPENIKSGILFNALLQELSEWNVDIGAALMSNISEVIDILLTLLESICTCRSDATFYEKTLWVVLMILNSILESDEQLTADDWDSLKTCLPSLQKLQKSDIDSDLKEIIFSIIIHIATHGAACKNGIEIMRDFMIGFPGYNDMNLKPNEQNLLELVEKFDRECNSPSRQHMRMITKDNNFSTTAAAAVKQIAKKKVAEKGGLKQPPIVPRKSPDGSKTNGESKKKDSSYESALKFIKNSSIPLRGHGLLYLINLIRQKDEETLHHKIDILRIFQENIGDEDSYIYHPAIQGLSLLAEIDPEFVLPVVLNKYQNSEEKQVILKLGEVLLKICNSLGDMVYKYKEQLLHAYLIGTRREDSQIRSSSLSNLGQACMCLKFKISDHWLQEILDCVLSFLKTDPDIEVRRCAVMVIYLLLKGVGKDMLKVLENEIRIVYQQLKLVYTNETDDVLHLHSQLALEEVNMIMKELLTAKIPLTKEIRILQ